MVQDRAAAEDVAQEAMLAAIRSLDRFNVRRRFEPWLHRIVTNRSIDWLRAQHGHRPLPLENMDDLAAPEVREVGVAAGAVDALRALDPEDRAIVVLRHVFDYTSREIGTAVGLPPRTVRTRLRRALARMREVLDEKGDEDALRAAR
jgi:RNA polymerase sigma-70 factor (ECF subfamily)